MNDVHDRIRAAVEARKARAGAATRGPWTAYADRHGMRGVAGKTGGVFAVHRRAGGYGFPPSLEDEACIAAESPDVVLRGCAEDLDVLQRHYPTTLGGAPLASHDECRCLDPWPCDEIRSLARRYNIPLDAP